MCDQGGVKHWQIHFKYFIKWHKMCFIYVTWQAHYSLLRLKMTQLIKVLSWIHEAAGENREIGS